MFTFIGMNFDLIEAWVVDEFFLKEARSRSKLLLANPKKRRDLFSKLCHSYTHRINEKCMTPVGQFNFFDAQYHKGDTLFEGLKGRWYVMAYSESIDRTVVTPSEAESIHRRQRMPVFYISCGGEGYFQAEYEKILPMFLLSTAR